MLASLPIDLRRIKCRLLYGFMETSLVCSSQSWPVKFHAQKFTSKFLSFGRDLEYLLKLHFFYTQVKTIYVKNLPENVSKEKIKELFDKHGEVTKIVLPPAKAGHKRDFGFVHFAERSSALKAVRGSEKYEIDGKPVSLLSSIMKFSVHL